MLRFRLPLPLGLCLPVSPAQLTNSPAPDKNQNLGLHSLRAIGTAAEPQSCTEENSVAVRLNQKAIKSYQHF